MRNTVLIFLPAMVLFCAKLALGQEPVRFDHGRKLLSEQKYSEARQLFSDLFSSSTNPELSSIYLFYRAKAGYYALSFKDALADFQKLIKDYPESPYLPYAHFFAGNTSYRQGDIDAAVESYLEAFRTSQDEKLDQTILASLKTIISEPGYPISEKIIISSVPETKSCELALTIAHSLMAQGNYQAVGSVLNYCPDSRSTQIRADADAMIKKEIEVGLVLPLSGELQKYGGSILDGALLMASQYVRETGKKISPVMYDTKGESIEAGRIIRRLFASGATAIIGPLTSEETAVSSAALSCSDLPLIAPAASQGGLTDLSSSCFQLQPTLDRQGTRMAEFAYLQMKFDTAAIMTPTTPDNLTMSDAFANRFKELGGTIIGIEYFRPRETDFGPLILDIKSIISGKLPDSAVFLNENGDTLEQNEVPVSLKCLFIPAEPAQLQQLLPQINFYNLKTTYLGSEGWGDKIVLGLGQDVYKACYFASARINDETASSYKKFRSDFSRKYKREPGYLEALGYDAMYLICQALKADNYSRPEITEYLSAVSNYRGVAGTVTFDKYRQNIALPVYTIQSGTAKIVKGP